MNLRDRLRAYVITLPGEASESTPLLDENKLSEFGKWIGGALTLLAGTLGFLGMQGGALDRMLRLYPRESMLTFCIIAAAVLCALLGPAVREGYRLRFHVLILGLLGAALVTAYMLPNMSQPGVPAHPFVPYLSRTVFWVLGICAVLTWRARISLRGAAFVIAVALLTFGTYASVKLSVLSKLSGRSLPSVSVSVQRNGRDYIVQSHVRVSALSSGQHVRLKLSHGADSSWVRFDPNGVGEIDNQADVPVPDTASTVSVSSQVCDSACDSRGEIENAVIALATSASPTSLAQRPDAQ